MCPTGCKHHPLPSPASPAIRPAFDVLDSDRDGRISRDDLRAFYSFFSPTASDDDIASMFSAADADRSGFVDFDEFRRVLPGIGGYGEGLMEEAFRVIDRDGDGRVGFDDLKAYLGWAGIHADDEEVRDMIRAGGCDEGVGVGFDDLLRILAVDFGQKF